MLIGGPSFLARDPDDAHASFEDAHEVLDVAESEIKRLSAIITAIPDADKETHRLLRLCAEHLSAGWLTRLDEEDAKAVLAWYFNERRTR